MMQRKVAKITGSGQVIAVEETMGDLKDNEVLIKVGASLVSPGTEMSGVKAKREKPNPAGTTSAFGYANAGEIISVKGDVKGLKVGMRVAAMGGGYAQHANYTSVPVNMVMPIPDAVSYEQASYACLGATALQAVRRAVPQLGEYGMVLGLGIVGNMAAQLSSLSGGRVIGWEGIDERISVARRCGLRDFANFIKADPVALTKRFAAPYGADFAIMAFGGNGEKAFDQIKGCMKVSADGHIMGRVVLVGGCSIKVSGGAGTGNLDIRSSARTGPGYHDPDYEYGKDYPGAFVQFTTQRNLREIITLIAEKRLVVDPMTTHRMPLEDCNKAADLLIEKPNEALGVIFQMSH